MRGDLEYDRNNGAIPPKAEAPQEAERQAFNDGCEDLSSNKEFDKFWEYLMESKNSDFHLKVSTKDQIASGPWFHRYMKRDEDF